MLFDLEKTYENIKAFPQKLGAPITGTVQTPSGQKMEAGCPVANLGKKSPVIKNKTQVMNFSIEYNGLQEISPDGPTIAPGWSPMIKYPPVVC